MSRAGDRLDRRPASAGRMLLGALALALSACAATGVEGPGEADLAVASAASQARPASAVAYPRHELTPGVADPAARAGGGGPDDVCVTGYAARHRHVLEEQYRAVYSEYGLRYPQPAGTYELDHLIPLELGGSNDDGNLWPEPAEPVPGFHQKDELENTLHARVCGGALDLAEAQRLIAEDWYGAYARFVASAPVGTPAPSP